MFKNIPIYNYLIMPRSGIISITVGATHGKQNLISVSPEGAEYKDGFLPNKFNPFRVVRHISFKVRGLHPRLLKLDPFGVTASELFMLKSVKYKAHWQIGKLAHSQRYYILSGISTPSSSIPFFTIPETTRESTNLKFLISGSSSFNME